jgi:hypothetical protein
MAVEAVVGVAARHFADITHRPRNEKRICEHQHGDADAIRRFFAMVRPALTPKSHDPSHRPFAIPYVDRSVALPALKRAGRMQADGRASYRMPARRAVARTKRPNGGPHAPGIAPDRHGCRCAGGSSSLSSSSLERLSVLFG